MPSAEVLESSDPAAARDAVRSALGVYDRLLSQDAAHRWAALAKMEALLIAGRLSESAAAPALEPDAWVRLREMGESMADEGYDGDHLLAIRACAALYLGRRDEATALAEELRGRDYPPSSFKRLCRASLGDAGQAPSRN